MKKNTLFLSSCLLAASGMFYAVLVLATPAKGQGPELGNCTSTQCSTIEAAASQECTDYGLGSAVSVSCTTGVEGATIYCTNGDITAECFTNGGVSYRCTELCS